MADQWHRSIRIEIKQLRDGARVWLDMVEHRDGHENVTLSRAAFYDSSLLSQELSSWIDGMCQSFSITETVGAPM